MSILVPRSHKDGSQLGQHGREWSNILSNNLYSSSSFIEGARITSGSLGLLVNNQPILVSPLTEAEAISAGVNNTSIVALRLNNLLQADGNYNMGGNTITGLGTPYFSTDAAPKFYVDNAVQGIKWKKSVRVSSYSESTENILWKERVSTITFTETGPNSNIYQLTSGHEGWIYTEGDGVNTVDKLFWRPPSSVTYILDPGSTHGNPGSTSINSGILRSDLNSNLTYSSGRSGDNNLSNFTINFKEDLFDGGTNGNEYSSLLLGERILVKDAVPASANGIWIVANTGSLTEDKHWYLQRPLDFNDSSEVSSAAVFVEEGFNNADYSYVVTTNSSSIGSQRIGNYDIAWSLFGTQQADGITIYKDANQSDRFEVTGVLRDINDLFYSYNSPGDYDGVTGRNNVADSVFLVGNGSTFTAESGNDARHSLQLGTQDSPTFTNLTLSGGELTASHLISNSSDPLIIESDLSGTVNLTVNNVNLDGTLSANSLSSITTTSVGSSLNVTTDASIGNNLTIDTGNLTLNNGNITLNQGDLSLTLGDISTNYLTSSHGVISNYLEVNSFSVLNDYNVVANYPEANAIYNINGILYWNGSPVAGGSSLGGQQKENIEFWGGNIFSENTLSLATGNYFIRLGVSGSNLDGTRAGTTNRNSDIQIVEGSFKWLTGSNVDIDGGTIDNTDINGGNIGLAIPVTSLTASNAKILDGEITGSHGKFSNLESPAVKISGGNIENTPIGEVTPSTGIFTGLTSSNLLVNNEVDINGGTIDGTQIGSTTPSSGIFTNLISDNLTASLEFKANNVDINGGLIDFVTIGMNSTINASTADFGTGSYYTLTASNFILPETNELGLLKLNVSNTSEASFITKSGAAELNVIATKGVFDILSGSSAEILGGNITSQNITVDNLSATEATINQLTGSNSRLLNAYGEFNILTGSDVLINGGNINNLTNLESQFITGSYIKLINELSASSNNVNFYFHDNRLQDVKTPDFSEEKTKDAVNREYIDKFVSIKTSVKVALSSQTNLLTLGNGDLVDNVQISTGDRILLTLQSGNTADTADWENGIWELTNTGWVRPFDFKEDNPIGSFLVFVEQGNNNSQSIYSITATNTNLISATNPGNRNKDILVRKVSSQYGVTTAGSGLSKETNILNVNINEGDWDNSNNNLRSNLKTYNAGVDGIKLILSESIRLDRLKIADSTGNDGKIEISGSNDSYIDNVKIGINTPTSAKFNNLNVTNGNSITLEGNSQITGSVGGTSSITLSEASFDKLTIPNNLTSEKTLAGEDLTTILGSFKLENNEPVDRTQRLYLKNGDLYFENDKIGSGGGTSTGPSLKEGEFTSLYVTGSSVDGHGAFISGSLIVEGNVQIRGTTTTISSSNTTLQDSIIGLGITGNGNDESFTNTGDRGIIFARGENPSSSLPGLWWDGSKFNFAKSITSPSSSSFGTITEKSDINVKDILANSVTASYVTASYVTASLGLQIGTSSTGYNFPVLDGDADQILVTDGAGNLTFQDNIPKTYVRDDLIITKDPGTHTNSNPSQNTDAFDLNGKNTDIFVLDFSNRSVTSSGWTSSSAKYLTIDVDNLSNEFHQAGKIFYVGIKGFDFTTYQSNYSAVVYLGFVLNTNISGYQRDNNAYQHHAAIYTTYTRFGNIQSTNISGTATPDQGARYQFMSGDLIPGSGLNPYASLFLDRVDTNTDKIYCLKFEIIEGSNGLLQWVSNFDEILVFDDNDPRFV